jgi:hypothetical protein
LIRKLLLCKLIGEESIRKLNSFFLACRHMSYFLCPHAHQQDDPTECKHRHTVKVGLSLLTYAFMPLKFWDEAFFTTVYLINRLPSKVISSQTPMQRLFGKTVIIMFCRSLGVLVDQISMPIISINCNFDLNSALFSDLVLSTKATNALIFLLVDCISHMISCLTS